MHRWDKLSESVFGWAFHLVLFLLVYELGAGSSFYLLEVSLVLLLLAGIFHFFASYGGNVARVFVVLWERLGRCLPLVVAAIAYLIWDAVTLLYTPSPAMGVEKYRVVVLMCLFTPCLVLYCGGQRQLTLVRWNITAAGAFLCLMVLLNFFVYAVYPIPYALRLSLRTDYNMFAVTILLGLCMGGYLLIGIPHWGLWERGAALGLLLVPELTVLYLSGSRRAYLLLWVILPLLLISLLRRTPRGTSVKQRAAVAGALVVGVGLLTAGGTTLVEGQMRRFMEEGGHPAVMEGPGEGTSAGQRYQTTTSGEMMGKRSILWRIAWEDAQTFQPREVLLGRGNGYDIILYDESEDGELIAAYPDTQYRLGKLSAHNLPLADYLGGGAVKLLLLAALLILLAAATLWLLLMDSFEAMPLAVGLGIVVVGSLISNRFGLLYDKFFYIYTALVCLEVTAKGKRGRRGGMA